MSCCNQTYNYSNNTNNQTISIPIRETVFTYSSGCNSGCNQAPLRVNGLTISSPSSTHGWGVDMEGPPLQINGSGLSITSLYCGESGETGNVYAVVAGNIIGCPSCITATVYLNDYDSPDIDQSNGYIGVMRLQCCGSCVMGTACLVKCGNDKNINGTAGTLTVNGICYCNCGIRTICITQINWAKNT